MNVFKFSRGDFFGIIVPGAFLVLNLLFLFSQNIQKYAIDNSVDLKNTLNEREGLLVIVFLVASYALGFALRVITPSYIEKMFFFAWMPINFIKILWARYCTKIDSKEKVKTLLSGKLSESWESFPYIQWFFGDYLDESPKSFKAFYKVLLRVQYGNDLESIKGKYFFNFCKLSIYTSSEALRDEVLFSEGLVRFLSGMSFSLLISIVIVLVGNPSFYYLLYPYFGLLLIFGLKLRPIRKKEVLSVFESFAIINNVNPASHKNAR